jgi:hypothetical protein
VKTTCTRLSVCDLLSGTKMSVGFSCKAVGGVRKVFARCFKVFARCLQGVSRCSQGLRKVFARCLQGVSRCSQGVRKVFQGVRKEFARCSQGVVEEKGVFVKNQLSKSRHTLLRGVNKFLPVLSTVLGGLGTML